MSIAAFPAQTQVQNWTNTMQLELIRRSPWEQMSNIIVETQEIPTVKAMKVVPSAVVIKLGGEFDEGSYQLTIPLMKKLNTKLVMGRQPAEGQEEAPVVKYKAVNYNVERKPMSVLEMSVDGQFDKFYKIGAKGTPLLTNYFVEMTDYNCHRALVEGASEALTETAYWDGASIATPPQTKKYNPTVMKRGGTTLATYSTTNSTFESNIQTYVDSLTTGSNPFTLVGLDSLINEMTQRLLPLGWKQDVDYVLLLSDYQCRELQDSSSTTGWSALLRAADPRETGSTSVDQNLEKDNRAISGILGIYRRTLLICNGRAPLWNTAGSAGAYMAYFKPWSSNGFLNSADAAISRATKSGAGVGTCETAIGLGKGAIGNPIIRQLSFDEQWKDYNFNKGLCASRIAGWVRLDFDQATPNTTSIQNQTSLLYFTPTPTIAF